MHPFTVRPNRVKFRLRRLTETVRFHAAHVLFSKQQLDAVTWSRNQRSRAAQYGSTTYCQWLSEATAERSEGRDDHCRHVFAALEAQTGMQSPFRDEQKPASQERFTHNKLTHHVTPRLQAAMNEICSLKFLSGRFRLFFFISEASSWSQPEFPVNTTVPQSVRDMSTSCHSGHDYYSFLPS